MSALTAFLLLYAAPGLAMGIATAQAIYHLERPDGFAEGFYIGVLGALAVLVWPVILGCALWAHASGQRSAS